MGLNVLGVRACVAGAVARRRPPLHELAAEMGLSEGELMAAHVGAGPRHRPSAGVPLQAVRLRPRWLGLLARLESLGELTLSTRNEAGELSVTACWQPGDLEGADLELLGFDGPLRHRLHCTTRSWHQGYATEEAHACRVVRRLQFFDDRGERLCSLTLPGDGDVTAWLALVARWADPDQRPGGLLSVRPASVATRVVSPVVDALAWRRTWASSRHEQALHEAGVDLGLSAEAALQLVGARYAQPVDSEALSEVLADAALQGLSLDVSTGCGSAWLTVRSEAAGVRLDGSCRCPRLHVSGPGMDWRLCESPLHRAWLVRRPSTYGLRTSLELFAASGQRLARVAARHETLRGDPCAWRLLLEQRFGSTLH
ncbi:putative heme degradation protein [Sphaerotilus hippei]|uniref:Putative heme degradation protein n=1 Tax=Sphaerotilus hippei TaxID=744406 RepID=A0A318HB55_9BURK|nr:ChuX/HutX family heme-like substrate-binding protein [Sphaerotilus hippei]PXW96127.1 putative heme degradation protein [Sphaerotilus hippei]